LDDTFSARSPITNDIVENFHKRDSLTYQERQPRIIVLNFFPKIWLFIACYGEVNRHTSDYSNVKQPKVAPPDEETIPLEPTGKSRRDHRVGSSGCRSRSEQRY